MPKKVMVFIMIGISAYIVSLITSLFCDYGIVSETGLSGHPIFTTFQQLCDISLILGVFFFFPYSLLSLFRLSVETAKLITFPYIIPNLIYWYLISVLIVEGCEIIGEKWESIMPKE